MRTGIVDPPRLPWLGNERGRDSLRQKLSGGADKRHPLLVFLGPRPLADEHQPRRWRAIGKHGLPPALRM